MIRLTDPQRRALVWLPSDGHWSPKLSRDIVSAINSLHLFHSELVEVRNGSYGPRGGYMSQARLTPAGIAERKFRTGER